MNRNISIVASIHDTKHNGTQQYNVATVDDLRKLKQVNPDSTVRYADITQLVRMVPTWIGN